MRTYKRFTSDQVLMLLKSRIEEMEQQHCMTEINLVAARAVASATPASESQRATSEQEADGLARQLESIGCAIDALLDRLAEAEKAANNRAHRRGDKSKVTPTEEPTG